MPETDAGLVERTREGQTAAFGALVERYRATVFGLAYARLGSRDDALDAAQETFLEAFANLHTLRDPERFRPWLLTILSRRCSAVLRTRYREAELRAQVSESEDRYRERSHPLSLELEEALRSLPAADRQALTLGVVEGLTYREIASHTQTSVAAVRSRLYRARARLVKELTPMSETATTLLTRDVMRRLLARVAELPHPVTAPGLASLISASEDTEVAEVAQGLASIMEQNEPLERAMILARALPPALTGLVWFGSQGGRSDTAARAAGRALEEGLLPPSAPVETTDVALFCASLGCLLQAGVPFLQALETAGRVSPTMAAVADHAVQQLAAGRFLSDVLADFPDIFTPAFGLIVRLGEEMAMLDTALTLLAGILWAPGTLDPAAITGPWREHLEQAQRQMEARAAWLAQNRS